MTDSGGGITHCPYSMLPIHDGSHLPSSPLLPLLLRPLQPAVLRRLLLPLPQLLLLRARPAQLGASCSPAGTMTTACASAALKPAGRTGAVRSACSERARPAGRTETNHTEDEIVIFCVPPPFAVVERTLVRPV